MKRLNDYLAEAVGNGLLWIGDRFLVLFGAALVVIAVVKVVT